MCDRNKQEILARELCILWWKCKHQCGVTTPATLPQYVDANWQGFMPTADEILELLDNHED